MAITLADFNKIWSSTSPLSPYTFSDDNYNEGWNFIGQIPPSRQMWDFLQKNNDEKMKYLADNYLPLSGGTIIGAITSSVSDTLKRNVNTNGLAIVGGTSSSSSAFLKVFGGDATGLKGYFALKANDGINSAELQGRPDGTLTWKGNNVATDKTETGAVTAAAGTLIYGILIKRSSIVELSFRVKEFSGAADAWTNVLNVPAGFRPTSTFDFPILNNTNGWSIQAQFDAPSGQIKARGAGGTISDITGHVVYFV